MLCVQVCDEPHPLLVKSMLEHCVNANIDEAYKVPLNVHSWEKNIQLQNKKNNKSKTMCVSADYRAALVSGIFTRGHHRKHLQSL